MPILNVKVSLPASAALTQSISETLLELTTRILHKKRRHTPYRFCKMVLSNVRRGIVQVICAECDFRGADDVFKHALSSVRAD